MPYTRLADTGLVVSRLSLGAKTFGSRASRFLFGPALALLVLPALAQEAPRSPTPKMVRDATLPGGAAVSKRPNVAASVWERLFKATIEGGSLSLAQPRSHIPVDGGTLCS